MKFDYQIIQIKNKHGAFLFLKPVPITRLIEFSWKIQAINQIINQLNITISQAIAIDELSDLLQLLDDSFKLSNLELKNFEISQLDELFDLLQTINKLKPTEEKTEKSFNLNKNSEQVTLYEYVSKMITLLVHLDLALDLKEAFEIADSFPADQLESMINCRIIQVDPEYEKRAKKEQVQKEAMTELIKDLKNGFSPPNDKKVKFLI